MVISQFTQNPVASTVFGPWNPDRGYTWLMQPQAEVGATVFKLQNQLLITLKNRIFTNLLPYFFLQAQLIWDPDSKDRR